MSRTSRSLLVLGTALLSTACATNNAPAGFLPTTLEAQRESFGGWIDVVHRTPTGVDRVTGELIAVNEDSLWIAGAAGGRVIATSDVRQGELIGYDAREGQVAGATLLGVISTVSNGVFLLFTAPMWLIGGSLATGSQSKLPVNDVPPAEWTDLAAFARFPQGMPPGLRLDQLRRNAR